MKLSFQTFCLIFVVTILHLVVITVFAPFTRSATDYFANLDVETILENGREDIVAIREREEMQREEEDVEVPESPSGDVEEAGEKIAATLLRAEKEAASGNEDGGVITGPTVAVAEPARGAVTDVRFLAERVDRPTLQKPAAEGRGEVRMSAGEQQEEPTVVRETGRIDPGPVRPDPLPDGPRLQVREIRPL